jgi:phosphoglycolate phosphatase
MGGMTSSAPIVGFDLDMTLIDSRTGIHACYL